MRGTSFDSCLLFMEFRFDAMLCSNFGKENSDVGHILNVHAAQPTPGLN